MLTLINSLLPALQDTPAETTGYMIAGYLVIFGLMAIYILSLYIRWRNLRQEAALYEDLEKPQDE
jgi:hypothetical protein